MNGKCLIIFYIIFYISRANSRLINPIIESDDESNSYDLSYDSDDFPTVRSSFAKTVTKFSCMADIDGMYTYYMYFCIVTKIITSHSKNER